VRNLFLIELLVSTLNASSFRNQKSVSVVSLSGDDRVAHIPVSYAPRTFFRSGPHPNGRWRRVESSSGLPRTLLHRSWKVTQAPTSTLIKYFPPKLTKTRFLLSSLLYQVNLPAISVTIQQLAILSFPLKYIPMET